MRNSDSLPTACQKTETFHTSCLRELLKIKWQDKISDTEVLKRAGMQSVHTLLKLAQLRWTGHGRLSKKILYGVLQVGKCSNGGQKKRYKDTLKASLKDFNIPTESWEQIAQDHTSGEGAGEYETKRISEAEQKRAQRKARAKDHQQSCLPQTSLVLSATGSLELRLVSSPILEHTNNNTSHCWLGLVIVSNDRRTRIFTANVFCMLLKIVSKCF